MGGQALLEICGLNGVDVFDTLCQMTGEQSRRKPFRCQHNESIAQLKFVLVNLVTSIIGATKWTF